MCKELLHRQFTILRCFEDADDLDDACGAIVSTVLARDFLP